MQTGILIKLGSKTPMLFGCALFLLLQVQKPAAPTTEGRALLAKVIEGLGGETRIREIRSVRAKGVSIREFDSTRILTTVETIIMYPDKLWQKMVVGDDEVTRVITPRDAFEKSSRGIESIDMVSVLWIVGQLRRDPIVVVQHAKDPGYEFEAGDATTVHGIETRALDVTTPDCVVRWFVDSRTGRIVRSSNRDLGMPATEDYSDFRQVQGVTFQFMEVDSVAGNKFGSLKLQLQLLEVNPKIDPAIFVRPGAEGLPAVSNREGKEIVAKVLQALGGKERIQSIKTVRAKSKIRIHNPSEEYETETIVALPDRVQHRVMSRRGNFAVVRVHRAAFVQADTSAGRTPGTSDRVLSLNDEMMHMPGLPKEEFLLEVDPAIFEIEPQCDPLFVAQHADSAGFVFTGRGATRVGNVEMLTLDVGCPSMEVRWLIDPQTNRVARAIWRIPWTYREVSKDYSMWKEVKGIWVPGRTEMTDPFKSGKVMTSEITEFEINPPIDTKVFEKKKPPVVDKPEMRSLTEARTIRIKEGWGGYGPGRSSEYELQRDANSFKGVAHFETEQRSGDQNVSIPLGIVTAFLKKLGESRLQDRQYVPYIDHTDDYPHVEIEVSTPAATVRFYSESQGEDHVPWAATIGNTTYVISSDVPARALESLSSYLERKVPLKVSPSVIAEQWLRSGMGKMNQRDLQGAIADFTKAIESKPDYYQAYEMRAQAKKMSNDYQGAIAEYTTLMRLAPGGTYLYERAQVKRELKDYQGAITDFTAFIESRPKYMLDVAYRARAAAKRELKDYGGEIADLTKLIELNSGRKDYGIYEERADAKYRSKDYRGVIEDLTKAVEIEPKLARGFYLRAKAKVELKDYRGAVADFTRAIDAVPDDPRDWYYTERGKAKQLLGDYQGAQADFEKAAELSRRKR